MKIYQYNTMGRTLENGSIENIVLTFTEDDVVEMYFPYWSAQMKKAGKFNEISIKNCIENWVVVNFAWEVKNTKQ